MDGSQPVNPYLSGNFAPVRSEDDFVLEVVGEIPAGLSGAFYRNGPNPQFAPRDDYHWFSGDGMIHAVFVEDGRATYRNRYVRTPKWVLEHEAGRALYGTFGNPMTSDPSVIGKDGGVANTNIVWHGGRLLALEEGHPPFELDPVTLDSKGYRNEYRGRVTAHPKMDPETGEMVWFAYSAGQLPFSDTVSYGVTDAAGKVTRRDDFEAPFSSMVHDFMVTRGHVLFPILPLTGSLQRAMSGGPAFAWEPDKGSHVGVMARDAGVETLRWFTTDPLYVFHPMNAWEEGSKIFADVMEYPRAPLFPNADGGRGQNAPARLVRWTFDLADASNTIRRQPLDDLAGEFPRFDERRAGLAYRHGWFAGNTERPGDVRFDCLAHIDTASGKRTIHELGPGDATGEPVFVPRSADAAEGDGWLVALIYRAAEDRSEFAVFDALDIAAGPVGAAKLPRRVPFGFHGNWRAA
ncbi:MAG: carotenoid oxygenase family protein [Caulobacteraceae bacterium]|nr:carotenoid oxygenase family protein [Caulobacteraceae bacterium]